MKASSQAPNHYMGIVHSGPNSRASPVVTATLVPACPEPENSQRSSGHFTSLGQSLWAPWGVVQSTQWRGNCLTWCWGFPWLRTLTPCRRWFFSHNSVALAFPKGTLAVIIQASSDLEKPQILAVYQISVVPPVYSSAPCRGHSCH